ncbi:MAG: hypothetical protein QG566_448 [Patescibacteria group bacterium]|jgi:hypothetical protein|nr:hypothetical protein [Patescibacteria group bacterium]
MRSIIPIIFICISIGAAFFYVKPIYTDTMSLRADLASYSTALANSKNLQKTRDSLIASYKAISPVDKERINRFLPNTVNNIQLILEVQQIASKHGLSIQNISFKPPVNDKVLPVADTKTPVKTSKTAKVKDVSLFGTFDLEFSTRSDYETFRLFVSDLEQNLRLIDIVSVDFVVPVLSKQMVDVDPNIYDFSLKIKTYWLKH